MTGHSIQDRNKSAQCSGSTQDEDTPILQAGQTKKVVRSYDERADGLSASAQHGNGRRQSELGWVRAAHNWAKATLLRRAVEAVRRNNQHPCVLDCGCGRGSEWAKLGTDPSLILSRYYGIDTSKASVEVAQRRYPTITARGPFFAYGDLTTPAPWRRAGSAYDVIAWMFSLHHTCSRDTEGLENALDHTRMACRGVGSQVIVIVPWGERVREACGEDGYTSDTFSLSRDPSDSREFDSVRFVVDALTPDKPEPVISVDRLHTAFARRGFRVAESGALDGLFVGTEHSRCTGHPLSQLYHYAIFELESTN